MKRPHLLLLTTCFPYDKGEEFLEAELIYLSKSFDVTIVPRISNKSPNNQRPIPSNVTLYSDIAFSSSRSLVQSLKWFIHHPSAFAVLTELLWKEHSLLLYRPSILYRFLAFATQAIQLTNTLTELHRTKQIDIVYSYWLSPSALAAVLLRQKEEIKIAVSRAHRGDLYHDRNPFGYLPAQAKMLAGLDEVLCISKHGADYLRQHHSTHCEKIKLSRLGVSPASVRNTQIENGRLHLVSCAYLTSVKRIHLLVEALARLFIPITWTHLGGGTLESIIREQARKLPANIQWRITGHQTNQDVLNFYQDNPVDLFVNVSASEGLPVSIMEALSYAIPVAATDVGGTQELIDSGKNGFLWPSDVTPQIIIETFTHFVQMSSIRIQTMRQAAWYTWYKTTNADVQYPAFVHHLLSLIKP